MTLKPPPSKEFDINEKNVSDEMAETKITHKNVLIDLLYLIFKHHDFAY